MGRLLPIALLIFTALLVITGCEESGGNQNLSSTTEPPAPVEAEATTETSSTSTENAQSTLDDPDCNAEFIPVKVAAEEIIIQQGLPGGGLLIWREGEPLCKVFYGVYNPSRPVTLVSAAKWLSSATIMTLVDDGLLDLDAPVSDYLSYLYGDHGKITMRQLLSHTSGLPMYTDCMFESRITLEGCSYEISQLPLEAEPGTEFIYSGVGYSLAGRIAESITGQFWAEIFAERIADPLGFELTNYGATYNPMLSEGYVRSTMDEYARFMEMMLNDGIYDGRQILSPEAIGEIFSDHSADVIKTAFPGGPGASAGLGVWRSLIDEAGIAHQISSPGGGGFVPWIDFERGVIGIFFIEARIEPVFSDITALQIQVREIIDGHF